MIRSPRISAIIGGSLVKSIISAEITTNGSGRSSRFEITLSTAGDSIDPLGLLLRQASSLFRLQSAPARQEMKLP